MKLKITSKFDLSDSVQYAQFRYFEDIGKLIADSGYSTRMEIECGSFSHSQNVNLKEINWRRFDYEKYDNINPFKYVLMDFIFETE